MKTMKYFRTPALPALVAGTVLLTALLPGCRKDSNEVPDPPATGGPGNVQTVYNFPLTIGSYWIYEQVSLDSNLNVIATGAIDSVFICADTLIHGDTFFVFGSQTTGSQTYLPVFILGSHYLRDSAGYLVDPAGVFIEHDNFADTLDSSLVQNYLQSYYFMRHPDSLVTVPAGTFATIDYRGDHYYLNPTFAPYRHSHTFFADDVGVISRITFFASLPGYVQQRLLRYHIQ
jgi:hypothetical protein